MRTALGSFAFAVGVNAAWALPWGLLRPGQRVTVAADGRVYSDAAAIAQQFPQYALWVIASSAVAMVLGVGLFGPAFAQRGLSMVAVNAFLFGGLAMGLVLLVGRQVSQDRTVLILLGTAINSLFGAGLAVLKYISNAEVLKNLDLWLMGGFWGANWTAIWTLLPVVVIATGLMLWRAWEFNALNAGEDVAATLGVNVRRTRTLALVSMTLVASVTIAFSGIIGFVGLVAPHVARSLFGVDHRFLIPASCASGAALLLASDLIARTVAPPQPGGAR